MHLLGCLLGLLLGLLLLVLNVGVRLWLNIRNILGGGEQNGQSSSNRSNGAYNRASSQSQQNSQYNRSNQYNRSTNQSNEGKSHSKVFADNEGEYVDFEEVKE